MNEAAASPRLDSWLQPAAVAALYGALERHTPSPVITLNRAVAVSKTEGAQAALDLIAPLEPRLSAYFHFHDVRGALLQQLGLDAQARAGEGGPVARRAGERL